MSGASIVKRLKHKSVYEVEDVRTEKRSRGGVMDVDESVARKMD